MTFKNVKYIDQKLLLSFDGCCDGKKVLGRLCIYHDNTPSIKQKIMNKNKSLSSDTYKTNTNSADLDDDHDDTNDDDNDQFFEEPLLSQNISSEHLNDDDDDEDDD